MPRVHCSAANTTKTHMRFLPHLLVEVQTQDDDGDYGVDGQFNAVDAEGPGHLPLQHGHDAVHPHGFLDTHGQVGQVVQIFARWRVGED